MLLKFDVICIISPFSFSFLLFSFLSFLSIISNILKKERLSSMSIRTSLLLNYVQLGYHRSWCCLHSSLCYTLEIYWIAMQGLPLQYADDSSASLHDLALDMQSNCRQLGSWLVKWRMGTNCSKTDVLRFSSPTAPLMINGERLTTSKYTTVLGLHLDTQMTFKT